MSQDQRPRRNLASLVIEPFKQITFGLHVISLSLGFVVVCGYMFFEAFSEQYQHVINIFQVVDPAKKWELVINDIFYTNALRIGLLFVLYMTLMLVIIFRLTHRYYGPLVSIERFVDDMTNGHYHRRAKIRDKDELHHLVEKLNHMAEVLEKRHKAGHLDDVG